MAVFNMIEEADATGKVKEGFEDIKKKRNTAVSSWTIKDLWINGKVKSSKSFIRISK